MSDTASEPAPDAPGFSRRDFLCAAASCAAAAAGSCVDPSHTPFFRNHLSELTPEAISGILAPLSIRYELRPTPMACSLAVHCFALATRFIRT